MDSQIKVTRAVNGMDWASGKYRGGVTQPAWEVRDLLEGVRLSLSFAGQRGLGWMVSGKVVGHSR